MGDGVILFELIESKEYTSQVSNLDDVERIDDILCGITFALAKNPYAFDVVSGIDDIRLLKTAPMGGEAVICVWLKIDQGKKSVHLLAIRKFLVDD